MACTKPKVSNIRNVCSLLVAHPAAVAATRVRFPEYCQILYIKYKSRGGEWTLLNHGNKKY